MGMYDTYCLTSLGEPLMDRPLSTKSATSYAASRPWRWSGKTAVPGSISSRHRFSLRFGEQSYLFYNPANSHRLQALEFYGLTSWRHYLLPRHLANAAIENFRITSAKVDRRLARTDDHRDLFSYILRRNDEKGMTEMELKLNMATIIGAGTGTTATWLSTTVYNLTRNWDAYQKLTEEIRQSFDSEEDITSERLARLPYLAAVMKESLRIHSPSPSSLGRFVPEDGAVIDGHFVPAGTTVGVHQHAINHSPSNFYRPDHYFPERWLPSGRDPKSPFAVDRLRAMQPFSYGARTCLGMKYGRRADRRHPLTGSRFSQVQTRIVLAKLFWLFGVELEEQSKDWQTVARGTVAWHRTSLICRLRERERERE